MRSSTVHDIDDRGQPNRHDKPGHLAEQMEAWVGRAFVVLGGTLLGCLLYAFMQTGPGAPSWMN
jgi:hypothetical protein